MLSERYWGLTPLTTPDDYDLVTSKVDTRLIIHTDHLSMNRVLFRDFDETVVPNQPLVATD
jgi:hypothetical protein